MKKHQIAVLLVAAFVVSIACIAVAAEPVSVTPPAKGEVTVTGPNGTLMHLKSTFPLEYGCPMAVGGGPCYVKGSAFSLTAEDKTKFSVNAEGGKVNIAIYSGKVHYVLRKGAQVKFSHPGAQARVYDIQEMTPGSDGNVSGYATVEGGKLVFAGDSGTLKLVTGAGDADAAPVVVAPAPGVVTSAAIATGLGVGAGLGAAAASGAFNSPSTSAK